MEISVANEWIFLVSHYTWFFSSLLPIFIYLHQISTLLTAFPPFVPRFLNDDSFLIGRTVISPDPNLRVDQVGVPVLVAKTMTYPERVNRYNLEKLKMCIENGPDKHPGANMVKKRFSEY